MKKSEKKNLAMLAGASVVLVAVNAALLVAARKGMIEPVANFPLWGAFVLLNIASVVWATALLGLQPMVVSLSYAVGGFLAYSGVRGMPGIHVAEVAAAGATYGAFGALAVGNATAKVRLAFFHKGQVPFVFIMVGLLVVDAALNSRVSQAGASVMLNAVVFPFLLAGVVVGLVWTLLNRFGIGRQPDALRAENRSADAEAGAAEPQVAKLVFRVPEEPAAAAPGPEPLAAVATAAQAVPHKPFAKPLAAEVQAVDGIGAADEEFFPLEIDKHDALGVGDDDASLLDFAAMLEENAGEGGLGVEIPCETMPFGAGSSDRDGAAGGTAVLEKPPATRTANQDAKVAGRSGAARPEAAKKDDDWLSGHLDLLNRLK